VPGWRGDGIVHLTLAVDPARGAVAITRISLDQPARDAGVKRNIARLMGLALR
jgi:hypothetical protein